jgi:tRNA(fMet)-specific endonuclease VapC
VYCGNAPPLGSGRSDGVGGAFRLCDFDDHELRTLHRIAKCSDQKNEQLKVDLLLSIVHEIAFDDPAAKESGRIRAFLESQGLMIGPYDVLLAGHALSLGLTLVTANTNEFGRVPSLKLENWQVPKAP